MAEWHYLLILIFKGKVLQANHPDTNLILQLWILDHVAKCDVAPLGCSALIILRDTSTKCAQTSSLRWLSC